MAYRFSLALTCLVLAAGPGTGCVTCTEEARASVQLTIVDAQTGEDVDAMVTFLLDGEGPNEPEEGWPGTYVLASETEGTFEVTITAAGYQSTVREYEVSGDQCHVDTVTDTVELTPAP